MQDANRAPGEIDCHTAVERLWAYLDHELDEREFAEVETHLETCAKCPPHYSFARTLLGEIHSSRAMHQEPGLLRLRVLHALRAEGFQPASP